MRGNLSSNSIETIRTGVLAGLGIGAAVTAPGHGLVHEAARLLFTAWQKVHFTITRGKAPDTSVAYEVLRLVDEADAAHRELREASEAAPQPEGGRQGL